MIQEVVSTYVKKMHRSSHSGIVARTPNLRGRLLVPYSNTWRRPRLANRLKPREVMGLHERVLMVAFLGFCKTYSHLGEEKFCRGNRKQGVGRVHGTGLYMTLTES